MQNYKFAMEYLKSIVGIVVVGLVIWSRISEQRAKQRRRAEAERRMVAERLDAEAEQWSSMVKGAMLKQDDGDESMSHDNFIPVSIPEIPEEGERSTIDMPQMPATIQSEESSVDVERWRQALIDTEILKTKF